MKLENVQVFLEGGLIGDLSVICDLLINQELDASEHPDNPTPSYVSDIEVCKIHMVEYQAFSNCGIVMTSRFLGDKKLKAQLEAAIIEEVEFKSIQDLKEAI